MIAPAIERAIEATERKRDELDAAQNAAEEALTCWFEEHFTELAKRYPKRRFEASSGMGSLSVDIAPGPNPFYSHHPNRPYSWIWNVTGGNDRRWQFLWQEWEDLLNTFAERTGLEYVNFTRDVIVTGERYVEEG